MRPKARVDLVEASIRKEGWNEQVIARLVIETGSSRASLYRDRNIILAKIASEEAETLPERRADFLLSLRLIREQARREGQYGPAVRTLAMELQVLGLDRVPLPDMEEETGAVDITLEVLLREVRRMRRQAQAGHSYVAADRLLEREVQIVESIRNRDEAERERNHAGLDEEQLVAAFEASAATLPETLKARLRAALGEG